MKRLGFGLSLLLLGFISNALHALGDTLRHTEIVTDCALLVSDTADFNGSIVFTSISNGTRNLFLMDTEQTLELGTGYYNQRNFYSAIDQSLLIWIRAATNQEGPISEAPDTLELWSLETNELLAHYSVPSNYFPLQRLDSGQLIVFDWHERVFLTVTVQQDHLLETDKIVEEAELPNAFGVSLIPRSFAEFAFSSDLRYVAYKVRDLSLAIYDIQTGEIVWQSPKVPRGMEPMSQPVWNATSDTLAAALFVEDEMQLFLIDPTTGEQTQLTNFPPDPRYGEPGMIPPGSHLSGIIWSPNNRYVTFTQDSEGLNILDTETMIVTKTCVNVHPLFWSPQSNYLFVAGRISENPVQVFDIVTNQVYSIAPNVSEVIGWSPLLAEEKQFKED